MKSIYILLLVLNMFIFPFSLSAVTPVAINEYSCGIFSSVLTSYDYISSGADHPANNDEACYTGTISYPENAIIGTIECNPNGCGGTAPCQRVDPPANTLDYTWADSSRLGILEATPTTTLTNYEYGNFNGNFNLTLNPATINSNGTKTMVLGDVTLTGANTLSLQPGDYFFNSLTFSANNPQIVLPNGGVVRIFIKNDFVVTKNGLNVNLAGSQNDLFVYVGGDLDFMTNGNVEVLKGYFYVEGSAKFDANSASFRVYGGITAEGPIIIEGNNGSFYQQGDSGNLGYGKCTLCFQKPIGTVATQVSTNILNNGNVALTNLFISKAYAYTGYTTSAYTTTTGTASSSSSINVTFDGYANFPNPSTKSGFVYNIGNFPATQSSTVTDTTNISFNLQDYNLTTSNAANVKALFIANYTDIDKNYNVIVEQCWTGGATSFQLTGPFDAWDIFRDNVATPPVDKNISTKVVNKPFQLSLASLNPTLTAYQGKPGAGQNVQVALYPKNSITPISNVVTFDANATAHVAASNNLTLTKASKEAIVGFKFCATYQNNLYTLFPAGSCNASILEACNATTTSTPSFHLCRSTDNLAVRPNDLVIAPPANLLTSGKDYNFTLSANQYALSSPTNDYNVTDVRNILNMNRIAMYQSPINDTVVDNTLSGVASYANTVFNIVNGTSYNIGMNFSDVGKVTIHLEDRIWSLVDIDDTPQTCLANTLFNSLTIPNGAFLCGDVNATFIPDHFDINASTLHNNGNSTFTYLSNDLNMSAHLSTTITAKNAVGVTTQNFKTNSWENPVNVSLSIPQANSTNAIKDDINETQNIGFTSGFITLNWDDTNATKRLMFNYPRDVNNSRNPFSKNGADINITANSTYTGPILITGTAPASNTATFIYGRTNAPKQVFVGNTGVVPIYYEAYCSGADCNKTLLPNGVASSSNDDPRWFVNTLHTSPAHGAVGTITQKNSLGTVLATAASTATPSLTTVTYDASKGYPYKTTMENNASSWLIYNRYNINDTNNEFEIEFLNTGGDWAGKHETDTATNPDASNRTNRRSMW